jgi:hypothetical protein
VCRIGIQHELGLNAKFLSYVCAFCVYDSGRPRSHSIHETDDFIAQKCPGVRRGYQKKGMSQDLQSAATSARLSQQIVEVFTESSRSGLSMRRSLCSSSPMNVGEPASVILLAADRSYQTRQRWFAISGRHNN